MDMTCCTDCKIQTEVVYDHATGDTVCSECGLILESHSIDTTAEWRTFSDDNNDHDPNRVGFASNPLLDTNELTTSIENPKGTKTSNLVNRYGGGGVAVNKAAHHLLTAFERLRRLSDKLGIVKIIEDSGCEIYKKVFYDENQKTCRGRNLDAALGACLLVACQLASNPRTVKEICSVIKESDYNNNVAKKDVLKAKTLILKQLGENNNYNNNNNVEIGRTIRAGGIVKRFCYNLGINDVQVLKAAVEAASNCEGEEVDIRRSPVSVAAAVIYVIVQLNDSDSVARPLLKDIASVTNVAEGTIKNTYKDLFPYVKKIVPTWFVSEAAFDKLCVP
ncbi:hypothetical protein RND81_11G144500 [Saponaria officinalis]|uniref:TFIIB-type domain-containing protein n=1 Tax=Saponaria officinalis TaxID=3572 RepID=A0AAW1HL58_SAPOF